MNPRTTPPGGTGSGHFAQEPATGTADRHPGPDQVGASRPVMAAPGTEATTTGPAGRARGRSALAGEDRAPNTGLRAGGTRTGRAGDEPDPDAGSRTASVGHRGGEPARARGGRAVREGPGRPVVLVLRALGLGDLLTAVPALRALRRALAGHELVLAAPPELEGVARATGCVDRLLPAAGPGRAVPDALPAEARRPDLAVNLHGSGPASHRLLASLAPRRLWAFHHPELPGLEGPPWDPYAHERHRWCALTAWYGCPADPDDVRITPPGTASPAPGAVVLHPGAQAPARRWPVARFAAVAAALRRAGLPVVVTAGPGEGPLATAVAAQAGLPPAAVLGVPRPLAFDALCGLVAHARCVVVGDTGLAHVATALGTPSVVLFGPVAPSLWGPPDNGLHRVLWRPSRGDDTARSGDPHAGRPDPRLLRITPGDVLDAVHALLPATAGAGS
ncbi:MULTISPECIES: glycosyltransferase family 9 protein [unclassified Streptomyces]|uniref:glycosyltransferase family 9 protein n=1 Tax=unclassified Streptomyces TaxID=2593676 RepID=UPI0036AA3ED9